MPALASAGRQCTWQVDDTQVHRQGTIYKRYMHTVENKPEFKEAPAPAKLFNACTDTVLTAAPAAAAVAWHKILHES